MKILKSERRGERASATLELACGCVHTFDLSADRLVETASGDVIAVGKYPCPAGHTLARR